MKTGIYINWFIIVLSILTLCGAIKYFYDGATKMGIVYCLYAMANFILSMIKQ